MSRTVACPNCGGYVAGWQQKKIARLVDAEGTLGFVLDAHVASSIVVRCGGKVAAPTSNRRQRASAIPGCGWEFSGTWEGLARALGLKTATGAEAAALAVKVNA